jgi:hypothetical protein
MKLNMTGSQMLMLMLMLRTTLLLCSAVLALD